MIRLVGLYLVLAGAVHADQPICNCPSVSVTVNGAGYSHSFVPATNPFPVDCVACPGSSQTTQLLAPRGRHEVSR
jgi:hypothetical protein